VPCTLEALMARVCPDGVGITLSYYWNKPEGLFIRRQMKSQTVP